MHEPVCGVLVQAIVAIGDSTDDNGAKCPKHLEHLRGGGSEPKRHDFAAVGRCVGNEDAPWNALEDLRRKEDRVAIGEIEDEDEAVQGHETTNGCPSISDLAGYGTCEEDANESTDGTGTLKGRLPGGRDEVFAFFGIVGSVVVCKSGKGNEVTHQENAVCLHDLYTVRQVEPEWEWDGRN